jgi:DNA anti-recombination protein RmuC
MSVAMELTKEQLEQIGSYIESNFDRFSAKSNVVQLRSYDIQLIERMTRIEEELRSQRELILKQNETMQFGFAQMDKRFESMQKQMDERFESMQKQMDERFDSMQKQMDERFESTLKQIDERFTASDRRFEMMQKSMESRFEQVDKRFDDANKRFDDVNKRFDDVNKKFSMMMWMMTAGFTIIATVITLLTIFAK